jgi:hypothetical protein
MRKGIHNRVVIIGCSLQKLAAQLGLPEYFLPAVRMLVDVLSEQSKRLCLWVPQTTACTQNGEPVG